MATFQAWQTERFAREDKLKPVSHYLKQARSAEKKSREQTASEKLLAYRAIAARGAPIRIEEVG